MNITLEIGLLVGSLLIVCSILISKTGYRFGIPTLLMFLLAGMLFGSDGLGIQFNDVSQAQHIGTVALCIILFSGGMDTKWKDIRPVLFPGAMLSTLGVLLTTLITGVFIYWISGWQQTEIGTIILIQCMQTGDLSAIEIIGSLLLQFAVGGAGGYLLGRLAVLGVNRINLKNSELYSILVLSFIFIIYCTTYLLKGNGYLAVYIAGMVISNSRLFKKKEIGTFLSGMTWLLQVVMFLILGLLVNPHEMLGVSITAILISLFMTLVARPASVWISLLPFGNKISNKSKAFISWVGLRGAAPIIFATYPVVEQVEGANDIFNIVFFVTLLSLLAQGMSLSKVAQKLGLSTPVTDNEENFGIEIPKSTGSQLHEVRCTRQLLAHGKHLRDISFPKGVLVMMIRRKDKYIVPNGNVELEEGDILLLIAENTATPPAPLPA